MEEHNHTMDKSSIHQDKPNLPSSARQDHDEYNKLDIMESENEEAPENETRNLATSSLKFAFFETSKDWFFFLTIHIARFSRKHFQINFSVSPGSTCKIFGTLRNISMAKKEVSHRLYKNVVPNTNKQGLRFSLEEGHNPEA